MCLVMGSVFGHGVAETSYIDAETLRREVLNHMPGRSDLYSQFIVEYNITKYNTLLNTPARWKWETWSLLPI